MGLEEFWDNITRPGFLSGSFEDLAEVCDEIKEDFRGLVEESEELLSHGLNNMFEDTSDFETTVERRETAYNDLKKLHVELMEARGLEGHWEEIISVAVDSLELIVSEIKDSEEAHEMIAATVKSLQNKYKHIIIPVPDEILELLEQVKNVMAIPGTPTYQAPSADENIMKLGPIGIFTSDKEKRTNATNIYVEEIEICKKEVQNEIDTLAENNPLFDVKIFKRDEEQLLISFCTHSDTIIRRNAFSNWEFPICCSAFHIDEKLSNMGASVGEKAGHTLENLLMMATGIYTILDAAIVTHKPIVDSHYENIQEMESLLKIRIESNSKKECKPGDIGDEDKNEYEAKDIFSSYSAVRGFSSGISRLFQ